MSLLRHVARTATRGRLLVVGTYRTGEVGAGHPLDDALGAIGSEAESRSLRLGGLGRDAVEALLATTAGAELVPALRCVSIDSVRKPWAMVVPNGVAFARSGSTWMNWWSWVMSAN